MQSPTNSKPLISIAEEINGTSNVACADDFLFFDDDDDSLSDIDSDDDDSLSDIDSDDDEEI